jgi:hypothetical protein
MKIGRDDHQQLLFREVVIDRVARKMTVCMTVVAGDENDFGASRNGDCTGVEWLVSTTCNDLGITDNCLPKLRY